MKLAKKVLSVVLALAIALGAFAVAASANGNPDADYQLKIWLTGAVGSAKWTTNSKVTINEGDESDPGATIEVYSEELATVGQHITTTSSSSDGTYSFSAPVGKYKIKVTCENFVTNYGYATLTNNITNLNIMLNPTDISGFNGQLRTVLTWGQYPEDLDSHMVGPQGDSRFHVFYKQMTADHSDLDVDDVTSYGPETLTVYETEPGVYSYYVHDFTNRDSSYSNGISTSGTKVQLYMGNVLKYTISAPAERDGTVWHVYDYDSRTGVVTLVNEYSYETDPDYVGLSNVQNRSVNNFDDFKKF
jgi:hypothetical protein